MQRSKLYGKPSNMNEHKEILEKFILKNTELEKLELMLSDFNLFETLNLVNAEIRHSNVLGWLLDPSQNHGIGYYFLNSFVKHFVSENKSYIDNLTIFDIESFNYNNVEIRREWKNVDILIIIKEPQNEFVFAIENKIKSSEHGNQLIRYREIIEREFKSYSKFYIFLTPESTVASDENWINFNYTTVSKLIEILIKSKKDLLNEIVITFIKHYNTILKRYIVGNSEIEKICKQIYKKHEAALKLIFKYNPDSGSGVSNIIQSLIKSNNKLILDSYGKTVIRFTTDVIENKIPKISEGWLKSKRLLVYEFSNYDNRLVLRLYIGPGDKEYREELFSYLSQNQDLFESTKRSSGKKWYRVYQKEFFNKEYEEKEFKELKEQIEEKWKDFSSNDMVEIDKYIEKR